MSSHLIFKFYFNAWGKPELGNTVHLHEEILKSFGKVWWGRTSGMSIDRLEVLKSQIAQGIDTYAFLFAIGVPRKIHPDTNLWFRAKILDVSLTKPNEEKLIPSYYRDNNELELYVLLKDIEPIQYSQGKTPRVPGQSAMRHVGFLGKPVPENLVSLNDSNVKICRIETNYLTSDSVNTNILHSKSIPDTENTKNHDLKLALRVIDLQEEVIQLQQQIDDLKTYREYYGKILETDYLFSSEKFFESWIQENMHKIFPELEVIDRQPYASWSDGKFGKLDLLAMNKETKDLAIIEVKTRKRSKKSGYDQYLRYTSWLKRNMVSLKDKYSEFNVIPSDQPQFIIITDYIDEEMTAICKDHGITLIHIFGGLGINRVA